MEEIKKELSKYGKVEICKSSGFVFSLLITGKGLTKASTYDAIVTILKKELDKHPIIECIKNEDHFLCMVLRRKLSNSLNNMIS
ncbi:hypothetical protein [Pustulibacterium marinum]|nr:hypothetical protein [Pustulibacterium marinum]